MTGIERLSEFVGGISPFTVVRGVTMTAYDREHMEEAGARLRDFLADIADQIERENTEDREAIAWVREHGGVDELTRMFQDADSRRVELCGALGIDLDKGWSEAMAAMRLRLMPEGCEWPRYEDGEPVRIGDDVINRFGDGPIKVRSVEFRDDNTTLHEGFKTDRMVIVYPGERVKRPAVPAADGEPLEVGQTVYNVNDGTEYKVGGIRDTADVDGDLCKIIECSNDELHIFYACFPPYKLTHQRPVLDADGVPIKKGDTVYLLPGEWCDEWPCYGFHGGEEFEVFADGEASHVPGGVQCRETEKKVGFRGTCYPQPSQLTHTKPEIDSWERIEEDARGLDSGVDRELLTHTHEDIVRRCKELAEKENRNE